MREKREGIVWYTEYAEITQADRPTIMRPARDVSIRVRVFVCLCCMHVRLHKLHCNEGDI